MLHEHNSGCSPYCNLLLALGLYELDTLHLRVLIDNDQDNVAKRCVKGCSGLLITNPRIIS